MPCTWPSRAILGFLCEAILQQVQSTSVFWCFTHPKLRFIKVNKNTENHNNFKIICLFLQNCPVRHVAGFPRSHHIFAEETQVYDPKNQADCLNSLT